MAEEVLKHILFHKALISDDEDEDYERFDHYLSLLDSLDTGDHLAIRDSYERSLALIFELVLENQLDPWNIDLVRFSLDYMEQVKRRENIDFVTAGRLIYMAWSVLKLQSDQVLDKLESPEEIEEVWIEPEGDWFTDDDAFSFTQQVLEEESPSPVREMIRHKRERQVSLIELIDAFEEVKNEAEKRKTRRRRRKEQRKKRKKKRQRDVKENIHTEIVESDIEEIWRRICQYNGGKIKFSTIAKPDHEDRITTMVSTLFLAHRRKINVWQQQFPYGDIFIKNLLSGQSDGTRRIRVLSETTLDSLDVSGSGSGPGSGLHSDTNRNLAM